MLLLKLLDEVSDKVLNKCDGVPLAIITIASLLVGKTPEQWIQEANFVIIPHNDGTMTIPPSGRVRSCDYKGLSLTSFKLLRVLALEGCKVQKGFIHLEHLESLLHLRYLGLIQSRIRELPKGIGALKFLQILHLENTAIEELPSSVGQLTQLICLRACKAKVPNGVIEKLTSLEELGISAHIHLTSIWETDLVKSLGSLRKIRHLKLDGPMGQDQALWGTTVLPRSLQCLIVPHIDFPALPSCIKPSYLPNLSHLELSVEDMDEKGLKILGGLPKLSHLWLDTSSRVTLTIHAIDYGCFFQTLRFLSLPNSTVWFVLNKDSSVSFTLWNAWHYKDFGTETREGVMPNLETLEFYAKVSTLSDDNGSCDNLGLECIPSLQKVKVNLWCGGAIPDGVEKAEAALRKAIEVLHPNSPTLEMVVYHFSGLILDPSLMLISAAGMVG
ncbi:hypothetical protein EJB05_49678, partial [Eragrostis curvula]